MNKFKKILSLLLVLALCLSIGVYTVSATDSDTDSVSDIELLNMLGIFNGYEDGSLHPELPITRMQYAALIMRILGYDKGIGKMETGFSDVREESWGSGYVKMAYDLGIISGYGDGTFRPESPVTQAESVKMLVAALGYGVAAERKGGFPQGYIAMASRLDLLENAVATTTQATRGYVATLLVNGLETKFLEEQVGTNTMTMSGETILERMNISLREGVLTAVYGSSINEGENLQQDEVMIENELFKTKLNISSDFVGNNVKIYVQNYGEDDELLVGITGSHSGKTLSVEALFILDETNLSYFAYEDENGKKRSVELEGNVKITYNGKPIDNSLDYTDDKLKPESGYVKLMDTNGNRKYDTAIVKDYDTIVVRSVTDRGIYGEFGNSINYEDEDTVVTVIYNNMLCSLADIKSGDVLSSAVSLDGSIAEIIICRDTTEGVVSALQEEEEGMIYILDSGEELIASPEYEAALSGGYSGAEKIQLGSSMEFYLNYFGEIALGKIAQESEKKEYYGYVVDMVKNDDFTMENILSFKILDENNQYIYLDTIDASTITFGRMEGSTYKKTKENSDYIYNAMLYNGKTERQMIKYELKNGAIKSLYLRDNNAFSNNFSRDIPRKTLSVSYHTIDGKYYWDDDTVCFYIPRNGSNISALSSGPCADYFSGEDSLVMELWDIEDDGRINAIYCSDTSTGRTLESGSLYYLDYVNSPVMYVTKAYNIVSDDGSDYKVVEGWQDKKLVRTLLSDTLSSNSSDIKPGVVIQYATNEQQKMFAETAEDDVTMVVYAVLFDMNDYSMNEFMSYDYTGSKLDGARIQFGYSNVSRYDYPFIRFEENDCVFEVHTGTTVYAYSRRTKEIKKVQAENLSEHTNVFMRARYGNLREVVIIED